MSKDKEITLNNYIRIIAGILFLILSCLIIYLPVKYFHVTFHENIFDISNEWTNEQGHPISTKPFTCDQSPSTKIYYTVKKPVSDNQMIIYYTRNMYSNIYVNQKIVSSDTVVCNPIFGTSPGVRWHYATIPASDTPVTICMENIPVYANSGGSMSEILLGKPTDVYTLLIFKLITPFIISILFLLIGIVLIIFYVVCRKKYNVGNEFCYLGFGTLFASIWSICESYLLQLLIGNTELLHTLSYIALISLPPVFSLILLAAKKNNTKIKFLTLIYAHLCFANTIVTILLHFLGIAEFHYTLFTTHILLIAFIPATFILQKNSMHRLKMKLNDILQLCGLAFFFVCVVVAVYHYYIGGYNDLSTYFRLCIITFLLSLVAYYINTLIKMIKNGEKADMLHTLAITDNLTGLYNRTALAEHQINYCKNNTQYIKVGIILLDINFLKQVNDNHGHEKGDQLLKYASNGILESFSQYGYCYRIGGDEFLVVITSSNPDHAYKNGILALDNYCSIHNSKVDPWCKLEIAHGYVYDCDMTFEEAMILADQKMYQNKKELKKKKTGH